MGEWNARSRIRLRSFYLLLRMHRCGQGSVRSEAGPEGKRASLSLSLRTTLSLSLSLTVFDAFSEHNKQTPPRNLFSYVRGHLPVYASFSTFSLARSFFFSFLLSFFSSSPFRIPSLSHLRQWPVYEPGRVRSLSLRPDRTGNVHLSSSYIRGTETNGGKNFGNFFHRHVFVQELTNHLLTNPRQGCDRAFQKERNWTNVSSGIVQWEKFVKTGFEGFAPSLDGNHHLRAVPFKARYACVIGEKRGGRAFGVAFEDRGCPTLPPARSYVETPFAAQFRFVAPPLPSANRIKRARLGPLAATTMENQRWKRRSSCTYVEDNSIESPIFPNVSSLRRRDLSDLHQERGRSFFHFVGSRGAKSRNERNGNDKWR